ncbi:MAG: cbb3-type cytochrome oxidase assembly protein CcoS [Spongiibacteraceae bacterium]|jgi:cbb3-type cytochrome oxidase maturation protein|nr:cbb3-type cytochrome oxidase assembly protein CcoS [Spongiibacteraceae bacterium]
MESLYILIPVAMLFLGIAVGCFMWAVNRRQFDDLERQGRSILFERELPPTQQQNEQPTTAVEPPKTDAEDARDDRR